MTEKNKVRDEILEAEEVLEQEERMDRAEEVLEKADKVEEAAKKEEITIEEEIGKLKAEVEDWKQSYLRKQADFQNFTKRKEREIDELRQYSSQKIVEKLLGSLDNLERAIAAAKETKDFDGLVQGVEMILRNIQDIMKSEGVEEIEALGKDFNPLYHHAVMQEDSPEHEDNEVMMEPQKGYKMKEKIIRPSMVKVCKRG